MDETQPEITVYIPCHNYGSFLVEAIESVLKQSFDSWELLIIDDASTDNTSAVIELYKGLPQVRTYETKGIKLPAVCNLALREARGKFIIRLDGDDVLDHNILLVLWTYLQRNPDTIMVFPDYYLMDQLGNIFSHERRRKLYEEDYLLDIPPNGACILAKTKILRELGGYREDLGAQDGFDLWTKVRDGYKCGNVNLPLFYYRRHNHNLTGASGESPIIQNARRSIKRDATSEKLKKSRPIIAVVPIRQYFDYKENFWKEELHERKMVDHALERLTSSHMFDHIVLSSDNDEAEECLEKYKDKRLRFHKRKYESTLRTASMSTLLMEIVKSLDPNFSGITVLNYVQAPFLTIGSVEEAVYSLLFADADAAISVEEFEDVNFYVKSAFGLQNMQFHRFQYLDGGKIFRNTNVCSAILNANIKRGNLNGPRLTHFSVTGPEGFFINNEYNLNIARLISEK